MTTERWFVGESELDQGEWGFDGTVWAAPTAEEIRADARGGPHAEPYLVAEGIRDEHYAKMIAASPDFYEAVTGHELPDLWRLSWLETVLYSLERGTAESDRGEDPEAWREAVRESREMCDRLRAAVAKVNDQNGGRIRQ